MVVSGALLPLDCLPSLTHHPWLQDISLVEFEYENIKIGIFSPIAIRSSLIKNVEDNLDY